MFCTRDDCLCAVVEGTSICEAGHEQEQTLIYAYTRADAFEDGALIDVSALAREAGFVWPVAITHDLSVDVDDIPPRLWGIASREGRLWDILFMAFCAIKVSQDKDGTTLVYSLFLPIGRKQHYSVKLVSGPGDNGEPVITLMKPDES